MFRLKHERFNNDEESKKHWRFAVLRKTMIGCNTFSPGRTFLTDIHICVMHLSVVLDPTAKATLKCSKLIVGSSRALQRYLSTGSQAQDAFITLLLLLVHLETYTRSLTLHFSALLCTSVMETIWMYFLTNNLWHCAYMWCERMFL